MQKRTAVLLSVAPRLAEIQAARIAAGRADVATMLAAMAEAVEAEAARTMPAVARAAAAMPAVARAFECALRKNTRTQLEKERLGRDKRANHAGAGLKPMLWSTALV